jgi:hypothetical protein
MMRIRSVWALTKWRYFLNESLRPPTAFWNWPATLSLFPSVTDGLADRFLDDALRLLCHAGDTILVHATVPPRDYAFTGSAATGRGNVLG